MRPDVARVFFWFCVAVIAIDVTLMLPPLEPVRDSVMPFAGWLPSLPYIFALRTFPPADTGDEDVRALRRRRLLTTTIMLTFFAGVGVWEFQALGAPVESTNVWLRVSAWSLVWTCVLPLGWAMVLLREYLRSRTGAMREATHKDSDARESHDSSSLRQAWTPRGAALLVAFAVAFVLFRWWEFGWRQRRGDYPGIGLKHTWYWWGGPILLSVAVFIVFAIISRLNRRDPASRG